MIIVNRYYLVGGGFAFVIVVFVLARFVGSPWVQIFFILGWLILAYFTLGFYVQKFKKIKRQ